jgi:hypothetical protein
MFGFITVECRSKDKKTCAKSGEKKEKIYKKCVACLQALRKCLWGGLEPPDPVIASSFLPTAFRSDVALGAPWHLSAPRQDHRHGLLSRVHLSGLISRRGFLIRLHLCCWDSCGHYHSLLSCCRLRHLLGRRSHCHRHGLLNRCGGPTAARPTWHCRHHCIWVWLRCSSPLWGLLPRWCGLANYEPIALKQPSLPLRRSGRCR